jgi:hypothetical protein
MSEPSNDTRYAAARIPADHPRGRDAATRTSAAIELPSGRAALPGCELAAIALAVARQACVRRGDPRPRGPAARRAVRDPRRRRRASASLCRHLDEAARSEPLARRVSAGRRRPTPKSASPQTTGRDPRAPRSPPTSARPGAPTCSTSRRSAACSPVSLTILAAGLRDPDASIAYPSRTLLPEEHELLRAWNRSERPLDPDVHLDATSNTRPPAPPTPPPSAAAPTRSPTPSLDRRAARLACSPARPRRRLRDPSSPSTSSARSTPSPRSSRSGGPAPPMCRSTSTTRRPASP